MKKLAFGVLLLVLILTALSFSYKQEKSIYHNGWIDLNKNGVKDIYEDPSQTTDKRVADLISKMTLEEKTCQLATLYGWKRVLKDSLPTPQWKEAIWKDGIANIDEHLNGFINWDKRNMSDLVTDLVTLHSDTTT